MVANYEITEAGKQVGEARVSKLGLYLYFSCRCNIPDGKLMRLIVECDGNRESLGICVPMGSSFGVETRIAAKKMGSGNLFFYLVGKDEHPQRTESLPLIAETAEPEITCNEQFVPVSEEEPFEQLDLLEDAHMEIREGEIGIVLPMQKNAPPADDADGADDQKSSSSPTGQWSEPNTSL